MVAAFDTSLTGHSANDQTSAAPSFTGAAGASIWCDITLARGSTDFTATTIAVTYNGVTGISLARQVPGSPSSMKQAFKLLNCCDGFVHNFSITLSGTANLAMIMYDIASFTGAGDIVGAVATTAMQQNAPTLTVTGVTANDVAVGGWSHGDTITALGPTQRGLDNVDGFTSGGNHGIATGTGTGSITITGTAVNADHWTGIAAVVQGPADNQTLPPDDRTGIPAAQLAPLVTVPMGRM